MTEPRQHNMRAFWLEQDRRMTMTLLQAAESLGVSPATLRQQIRNGKLKATKLGRDWTVRRAEVERYRRESRGRRTKADQEQTS